MIKIGLFHRIRRRLQPSNKPLSIHLEALHIPQVQRELYKFLNEMGSARSRLYCITPINELYVEGFFGPLSKDYDEQVKTPYQHLIQLGYALQLHVHLTRIPNVLSPEVKADMINHAYEWMESIGAKPTELVLGWFAKEDGVAELCRELGLRLWGMTEHLRAFKVIHDYNLVGAQ